MTVEQAMKKIVKGNCLCGAQDEKTILLALQIKIEKVTSVTFIIYTISTFTYTTIPYSYYTTTIKYDFIITTNTASTTGTITLFYTVHVLLVQLTKKKCLLCNSLFLWFSYKVAEATIMYQVNHVLSQPRLWGTLL